MNYPLKNQTDRIKSIINYRNAIHKSKSCVNVEVGHIILLLFTPWGNNKFRFSSSSSSNKFILAISLKKCHDRFTNLWLECLAITITYQ